MTIVVFLSVLFIWTQVMNITCNRVVYIYIVIIFVIIKNIWHVVQSVNDLYCVCYAVVQFDNTNNTNTFFETVLAPCSLFL